MDGGTITQLDDGQWTFNNPLLSRNRKWLGLSLETLEQAAEAHVTTCSIFEPKKVSQVNAQLKQWKMAQTQVVCWKSEDGTEIEGLLTYPKEYSPGTRYPFLLVIHGGPMGVFSENFLGDYGIYPLAAFADAGFVVLRANPRGSCGYGREFRQAVCADWGGHDYQDLLSGVNTLIDKGVIDPHRMGVMGWSYGGYMTAWIVSQTNQFAAASMGAGMSNLWSFSATTDIHHYMSDYLGGEPWDKSTLYIQRSPIYYTHQVTTPLLIQHGEQDERVPFSQGLEFYQSLRKAKKPVVFAAYPRSTHRILEPRLQLDALQRNFDWFIDKVKNKPSE